MNDLLYATSIEDIRLEVFDVEGELQFWLRAGEFPLYPPTPYLDEAVMGAMPTAPIPEQLREIRRIVDDLLKVMNTKKTLADIIPLPLS